MKIGKTIITIVIVIGLLAWGAFTLINNKKKQEEQTNIVAQVNERVSVNTGKVAYEKINLEYAANGVFEPLQELDFPSEISGKVISVNVDVGDLVKTGQILAVLKDDEQSINLSAAEAAYRNALTDNQRYENAFKTGGVTQQQLDATRLKLENAKAQLDQAKIKVGNTYVRATFNGIVNARYIEPGSYMSAGTKMFEIVNISKLKLKVDVDESNIANLKTGDKVKIKASIYPNKEFIGKITFIAPKAITSLNFPVEIAVTNENGNALKAGMYGTAIFSSSDNPDKSKPILVVPRDAFVGGVNSDQVFIVKDDVAQLKKIISGRNFGNTIEVLNGLQEGDIVVTSGQINLTDGAKIQIIDN